MNGIQPHDRRYNMVIVLVWLVIMDIIIVKYVMDCGGVEETTATILKAFAKVGFHPNILKTSMSFIMIILILHLIGFGMCVYFNRDYVPFGYLIIENYIDTSIYPSDQPYTYVEDWIAERVIPKYQTNGMLFMQKEMVAEWDKRCQQYLKSLIFWRNRKKQIYLNMRATIIHQQYQIFKFILTKSRRKCKKMNRLTVYKEGVSSNDVPLTLQEALLLEASVRQRGGQTNKVIVTQETTQSM